MRSDRLLLQDMLESINEVIDSTPPAKAAFDADKFLRSHVLRHIQIIGEVAWRLSGAFKDSHPQVPWKLIAGMRHVLVHDYFRVDWNEVFRTATHDSPMLKVQIEAVLALLPADEP